MGVAGPFVCEKHACEEAVVREKQEGEKCLWRVGNEYCEHKSTASCHTAPVDHLLRCYGAIA